MKKVLVADDSMFMRKTLKDILVKNGYDIIGEAENGKRAVEMYQELSPDIVTLDITMHEMTGLEALRNIIAFDSGAKVVMVSAMGQDAFVKDALDNGAKGFIVKPFKHSAVLSALSSL